MRAIDFFDTHPVFTHREFVSEYTAAGRSALTANTFLHRHLAAGRILRVRRGVYAVVARGEDPAKAAVDPYLVASALAGDATVAYHAALQFHGKAASISRRFHCLVRDRARPFSFRGAEFVPVRAAPRLLERKDLGGGILHEPHAGGRARVTTLERALVDVLAAPARGGGWEEIWRSLELVEFFDLDAVVDYARKLGSAIAAARTGFFLERHRGPLMVEEAHLEKLRKLGPREPRYFDARQRHGRFVPRWNLVVPEQILARAWEEWEVDEE
jgi:predicted transcriptional regulator of viral defense system